MDPTASRKLPIEIPLPSKPRDYRSGDGPALAPIRLALKNDTGAFIIDKRVLPGESTHGEPKVELYYIVGWPDLPAASVAILATKILDYVSPRTLEDWEYKYSLEKDQVRHKKETPRQRLGQQKRAKTSQELTATAATATAITTSKTTSRVPEQGRLSKAELLARQIAEQASLGDEELPNVPLPPASTKGPSLSTPQKRLAQLAKDTADLEETDTNTAIPEQICGDSDDDGDIDSQVADEFGELHQPISSRNSLDFTSLTSFHPAPSFRGHSQFLSLSTPSSSTHGDSTPSTSIQVTLQSTSKKRPSRQAPLLTAPMSAPSLLGQSTKRTPKPPPKVSPVAAPSYESRPKAPKQPHVVKETPVPPPEYSIPNQKPALPRKSRSAQIRGSASTTSKSEVSHKTTFTPVPVPTYPLLQEERSKKPDSSKKSQRLSNIAAPPPSDSLPNGTKGSDKPIGFTPIRPGGGKEAAGTTSENKRNGQTRTRSVSATPTTKAGSTRKRKRRPTEPEPEWEVKRLEDDKVIETGGELVRYFKVRWEGKWPRGENPTWEPEELIGQDIVRKYLKGKAAKMTKGGSPAGRVSQPTPTMERKYASVAEAFAGDLDDN